MRANTLLRGTAAVLLLWAMQAGMGCDTFQTETYVISDLDAQACEFLMNDSARLIETAYLTQFDTSWTDSAVAEQVSAIMDSLEANKIVISASDIVSQIALSDEWPVTYAILTSDGGEQVFYYNDYLDVRVYSENGEQVVVKSTAIAPETILECPELKTRLLFALPGKKSLLQFTRGDQTIQRTIVQVILPNR